MRHALVVAVLAVMLAGCNAPLVPGETPSPTLDATSTPSATTTPSTRGTERPAPADVGISADGVVDPGTLADAHDGHLRNRSYTSVRTVTVQRPDGTTVVRKRQRVVVAAGAERFSWNETREVDGEAPSWLLALFDGPEAERAFSNGTTTVIARVADGERSVNSYDQTVLEGPQFPGPGRSFTGREFVSRTFGGVETRVTGVKRRNGTVRYRLTATDGPHEFEPGAGPAAATVRSLSASVERSGVVRHLALRYTVEHEGDRFVVATVLSVSAVGSTTAERPAWVEQPYSAGPGPAAHTAGPGPAVWPARTSP